MSSFIYILTYLTAFDNAVFNVYEKSAPLLTFLYVLNASSISSNEYSIGALDSIELYSDTRSKLESITFWNLFMYWKNSNVR